MGSRKSSFLSLGGAEKVNPVTSGPEFEFQESEIWNWGTNEVVQADQEPKRVGGGKKPMVKGKNKVGDRPMIGLSAPVKVPDWSKILGDQYETRRPENDEVDYDDDEEDGRLPPHEYLARNRDASSFSVHESFGRLKGRDLRRVRNAIWKQTGFED